MRYITKQLYDSMQFFHGYFDPIGSKPYDDFVFREMHAREICEDYDHCEDCGFREHCHYYKYYDGINTANVMYRMHMQTRFKVGILNYDVIKNFAFDESNALKPLDKEIYDKFIILCKEYIKHQGGVFQTVTDKIEEIIKNKNIPDSIKMLAKSRVHDHDIIVFEACENNFTLSLSFGENVTTFIFKTVKGWEPEKISNITDFKVLYRELFINDGNTFEFNILIWGPLSSDADNTEEISIKFYDVQIERNY